MNKNILIGIVAFGGILLIGAQFFGDNTKPENGIINDEKTTLSIPANVPTYPDATIDNITDANGEDGIYFLTVSLIAKATKAEVNTWYRNALNQNGWSILSDKNVAGYQIIQAENKNEKLFTSFQTASSNEVGQVIVSQQIQIRK
ncbi:MAG TPA: hypothetical protein ENI66_01665 [Candidatus Yonathbacteria bacterium]|nr:hypothetical protein [Candidatus Yonathbacteria bacterium]